MRAARKTEQGGASKLSLVAGLAIIAAVGYHYLVERRDPRRDWRLDR